MNEDKMELEEAKEYLEQFIGIKKDYKYQPIKIKTMINTREAIETVLEELKENKGMIEQLTYTIQNSILKKKIEDLLEEVYTDEGIGYELDKDEKPGAVRVLKKLLEDE